MARAIFIFYSLFHVTVLSSGQNPCFKRNYGQGSVVCVCNTTYCDTVGYIDKLSPGKIQVFESNKEGLRLQKKVLSFSPKPRNQSINGQKWASASVNKNRRFQQILGFGGCFTDTSVLNIGNLPPNMQKMLLKSYYSPEGIEYSVGRVPMASTDFSTHVYSYDDVPGDFNLTYFKLSEEDVKYKVPFLHQVFIMSERPIRLFASPWSSPAWMKTSENMTGNGTIKGELGGAYYNTWAKYFVKFLKAYEAYNIKFWGLTTENEPTNGLQYNFSFQCLGFTPESQRDFIKMHLGPSLETAGYKLKIMIMDDQRFLLPKWADVVLSDPQAAKYVSGVGFHWYWNEISPPQLLDITHNSFPEHFLLATEACEGSWPWEHVVLGSWERGEGYAHDILEDLSHWTVGWVDWNLAVDLEGGPSWVGNSADAPIVVNSTGKEFYKQPTYYAMAHFSKFVPPGSQRIELKHETNTNLEMVAFLSPNKSVVIVVVNRSSDPVMLTLEDPDLGSFNNVVSPRSFQTYLWSSG